MATVHRLKGHRGRVNCVCFGKASPIALSGSSDSRALVWCLATGKVLNELPHDCSVVACELVRQDKNVATVTIKDVLFLWDYETSTVLRRVSNFPEGILSIHYPLRGRAGNDFAIKTLRKQWYLFQLSSECNINAKNIRMDFINIRADGTEIERSKSCDIIIGSNPVEASDIVEGNISIEYDKDGGEEVLMANRGLQVTIFTGQMRLTSVTFNENTQRVCTSGVDGIVKVFNISKIDEKNPYIWVPEQVFDSHSEAVNCVRLSSDGSFMITASDDCTCFFVDLRPNERALLLTMSHALHPRLGASSNLKDIWSIHSIRHQVKQFLI